MAVIGPQFPPVYETSYFEKQSSSQNILLKNFIGRSRCSCFHEPIQSRHDSLKCIVTPSSSSLINCQQSGAVAFFPKDIVHHEMTITMQSFDYGLKSCNQCYEHNLLPASNVLEMGPNRSQFKNPLYVALPLKQNHSCISSALRIRYSETTMGDTPDWKYIDCSRIVLNGTSFAVFSINHFTIFQAVWQKVSDNLKPVLSLFPKRNDVEKKNVCFKAYMTDVSETNQFGIMVVCVDENSNLKSPKYYNTEIGMSMPRQLMPGKISLRLKSSFFDGDQDIDEVLEKCVEFTGDDFDVQFACQVKSSIPDVCLFGQVQIIPQYETTASSNISFNLMKVKSQRSNHVKTIMNQVESDILEKLAEEIGASKELLCDALTLLSNNAGLKRIKVDPSLESLYKMLSLEKNFETTSESKEADSTAVVPCERDSSMPPLSKESNSSSLEDNCLQSTRLNCRKRKRELHDNGEFLDESACLDIASGIIHAWKFIGRYLGLSEQHLIEIELDCRYDNEQEKAFQMLMAWKQAFPEQCTTKTLGAALRKCRLNYSASRLGYY